MFKKNILFFIILIGIFILSSCYKGNLLEISNSTQISIEKKNKNGYLVFKNQDAFNRCIDKLKETESKNIPFTRSIIEPYTSDTENFKSIASLKEELSHKTRGIKFTDDAGEEMTFDEFNIGWF